MAMDLQSSGALLRILNLVALADGHCSPEEEHLLDSLTKQHRLQAKILSWLDGMEDPSDVAALAEKIAPEHHYLTMKTATMVAAISRPQGDDEFVSPEEAQLLETLSSSLALSAERLAEARDEAEQELTKQPSLWQALYACFGSQFERPFLI
jgi:tellurite resistance protein